MTDLRDLLHRLLRAWMWILGQFIGTAIFLIIGLAWTRLPDSHVWQVALTLIIPLLLAISVLELEAATMRSLADNDGRRVKLVLGALTFLIWIALGCVAWLVLNWCDEQLPQWSGYLNSRTSAHWRAKVLTYQHIQHGLTIVEWILRWIVVPGKLIPMAMASAQWGLRIPLGRIIRLLFSGRWCCGFDGGAVPENVYCGGRDSGGIQPGTATVRIENQDTRVPGIHPAPAPCASL